MITNARGSDQSLAKNATVGMRFPSAQVVRFSDARAMQLAKALQSNGRWRLVVFGGDLLEVKGYERLTKVWGTHFVLHPNPLQDLRQSNDCF
jgi:phenol 2-monooxygenase